MRANMRSEGKKEWNHFRIITDDKCGVTSPSLSSLSSRHATSLNTTSTKEP